MTVVQIKRKFRNFPEAPALPRREFEYGGAAPTRGRSPWRQVGHDLQHPEVPIEKQDIDWEAHEARVDRRGGTEKQAFARLELGSPEQPFDPGERRGGDDAPLANRPPVSRFDPRFQGS